MIDRELAARARRRLGVLTDDDLTEVGVSDRQRKRRLSEGSLERLHNGVLGIAGAPASWERAATAALLALGGSVLSHGSAARLHRFAPFDVDDRVTVTGPIGAHHDLAGVDVRRSRLILPSHVTEVDGLAVTTRSRTLIDLAAELSDGRLQRLVEEELGHRRVTFPELVRVRADLSARGRPGVARFRRVIERIEGKPPTESELERIYLQLLAQAGVPLPTMQVTAPWSDVEPGRVDAMYVEARSIIELDGRTFHVRASALERDHRRDQLATMRGFRTSRFTFQQIRSDPRHVIEMSRYLSRPHT